MPRPLFHMLERSMRWSLRSRGYRSRYVESLGNQVHFFEAKGKGALPPIVLIHGLCAAAVDLAPMFRTLRRNTRRLIAPDLPGHGLSTVPSQGMRAKPAFAVLSRALNQVLGDEPALVVGNSLGGLAAIRYANSNPDKVRGLVLISPGGASMSAAELAGFKLIFENRTKAQAARFLDALMLQPPWYRSVVERMILHRFRHPHVRELIDHIQPEVLLQPEEVSNLKPPTLLIWGQSDMLLHGQLDFFKAHAPAHMEIQEPAHFSHCPFMDDPHPLNHMVLEFARRIGA